MVPGTDTYTNVITGYLIASSSVNPLSYRQLVTIVPSTSQVGALDSNKIVQINVSSTGSVLVKYSKNSHGRGSTLSYFFGAVNSNSNTFFASTVHLHHG